MAEATIRYDVGTTHWPVESTLVQLDPPLRRYDVKTGEPVDYDHVIVHIRSPRTHSGNSGADLFAATEAADAIHTTMIPLDSFEYGALHSVLKSMGYEVTN